MLYLRIVEEFFRVLTFNKTLWWKREQPPHGTPPLMSGLDTLSCSAGFKARQNTLLLCLRGVTTLQLRTIQSQSALAGLVNDVLLR